jgi:hypothetical protein
MHALELRACSNAASLTLFGVAIFALATDDFSNPERDYLILGRIALNSATSKLTLRVRIRGSRSSWRFATAAPVVVGPEVQLSTAGRLLPRLRFGLGYVGSALAIIT